MSIKSVVNNYFNSPSVLCHAKKHTPKEKVLAGFCVATYLFVAPPVGFGIAKGICHLTSKKVKTGASKPEAQKVDKAAEPIWRTKFKANALGSKKAQNDLGERYLNGNGIKQDPKRAVEYFKRAAFYNTTSTTYSVGDDVKVLRGLGNKKAINNLAQCYEKGTGGLTKSEVTAVNLYKKAAKAGDAQAQYNLGRCFAERIGKPKDLERAFVWFKEAANNGDAKAQYKIASWYRDGTVVAKNDKIATEWFKKAADQGHADSQREYGYRLRHGLGIGKDVNEGFKYTQMSAKNGSTAGLNSLGYCYDTGSGVAKNADEAAKYYRLAYEKGHITACSNLAECYEKGTGVEVNLPKAIELHEQAAAKGNENSKKALERLKPAAP